ncbi:MAG: hypothetical protein OXN27_16960 [Candidatus Poribacteria bacterium]|nr:hypothetical protein [Candidatus Poribacteria bacterium]MDE0325606.1 hypothetical protein [Candidatus Poribacteria bacterium]
MKTLKTSKKDKEGGAQPPCETLRKVFIGNISIFLEDAFQQPTRHRNNGLGEERRRILIISKLADKSVTMRSERRL